MYNEKVKLKRHNEGKYVQKDSRGSEVQGFCCEYIVLRMLLMVVLSCGRKWHLML